MTLAQETNTILLDEPTTFLDLAHQLEVLDLVHNLNQQGKTIILVLHDLNHAAHCADHIVALHNGAVVAQGSPHEVIVADVVQRVFGVESYIMHNPVTGQPMCLPVRLAG